MERRFNLIDEPWLFVLRQDYSVAPVSLRDVFANAHEYRALAGELPTQDVAILRLLLAILYAVFLRQDADGSSSPLTEEEYADDADALQRWASLWKMGRFPAEVIGAYLDKMHDRFYLIDPERPFFQVPGMDQMKKKSGEPLSVNSVNKLDASLDKSDHKSRLFTMVDQNARAEMTHAEAARWLLNLVAFGDCSAKPSPKMPWLGSMDAVYATGGNLWQTLMMNLVMYDRRSELWPIGQETDRPCWERHTLPRFEPIVPPRSPMALLTVQSRQVLLVENEAGTGVRGFYWQGGEHFEPKNIFTEQMTMWRADRKDPNIYLPKRSAQAGYLWRDFASLAVQAKGDSHTQLPGIIRWLSETREFIGCHIVDMHRVSIAYGTMNSSIISVDEGALSFSIDLLSELGEAWCVRVKDEVALAEKLAEYLGYLADDLRKAGGSIPEAAKIKEDFYYQIDMPFRSWLQGIDPIRDTDRDALVGIWRQQEQKILHRIARALVDQAGSQAFVGRMETDKKTRKETRHCAPECYDRFCAMVRKCIGGENHAE